MLIANKRSKNFSFIFNIYKDYYFYTLTEIFKKNEIKIEKDLIIEISNFKTFFRVNKFIGKDYILENSSFNFFNEKIDLFNFLSNKNLNEKTFELIEKFLKNPMGSIDDTFKSTLFPMFKNIHNKDYEMDRHLNRFIKRILSYPKEKKTDLIPIFKYISEQENFKKYKY